MLLRVVLLSFFLSLCLFGAPNIEQLKAAVIADPSLLDTPQAKAMMKDSGWWIFTSSIDIQKGDTVVVPLYIQEYIKLELMEGISKILASFAITVASLSTLGII